MRRIVIFNQTTNDDLTIQAQVLFRLDVPLALRQAAPGAVSQDPGATSVETTALQNGSVVEHVFASPAMPQTTPGAYVTDQLIRNFNEMQALLTSKVPSKMFAGAVWDGTTWTGVPV